MTCSRVTQFKKTKKLNQFEKVELHEAILTLLSRSATSYVHHNGTEFTRVKEADILSVREGRGYFIGGKMVV